MFTPQHTKMQRSTFTRKPHCLETVSIEPLLNIAGNRMSSEPALETSGALDSFTERYGFLAKLNIYGL